MIHCRVDLKDLTRLREIPREILNHGFWNEVGQYMVSSTQRKIKEGIAPDNAPLTRAYKKGGLTLRDTGRLMGSIAYRADSTSTTVGTNLIYGRIQQLGGTIKPRSAKKLWVPAGWNTRKLMRRYGHTPSSVMQGMKASGYRVWISKSGKAVLAAERGKKAKPFVVFVLKDEVTIPARRYLDIDSTDRQIIINKVGKWLKSKT